MGRKVNEERDRRMGNRRGWQRERWKRGESLEAERNMRKKRRE